MSTFSSNRVFHVLCTTFFIISTLSFSFPAAATKDVLVPVFFVNLSKDTGVPADVLYALSVTETNTKMNNNTMSPWPFTINHKGIGKRYSSYEAMLSAVKSLIAQGYTSIDIGPFQVNWYWHKHRVDSLEELSMPYKNGLVAAEILLEQYTIYGNWIEAAGRYHNPANNDGHADKYSKNFSRHLESIQSGRYQRHLRSS